jgi:hypothetical protein
MTEKKAPPKAEKKAPKLSKESIKIELFGDLLKFSKKNPREILPLKKYDTLAIGLVNSPRTERLLIYRFLCGLALSAHARRTNEPNVRRDIFDLKNKIFLSIANDLSLRKVLNFRFCVNKRFKVVEYCEACSRKNEEENLGLKEKAFCNRCKIDRTFYNVLSMYHKFDDGGASLYLGKELIPQVHALKLVKHVDIEKLPEQLAFHNLRFTPHNLVSLDLVSVMDVSNKLLAIAAKDSSFTLETTPSKQSTLGATSQGTAKPATSFSLRPRR